MFGSGPATVMQVGGSVVGFGGAVVGGGGGGAKGGRSSFPNAAHWGFGARALFYWVVKYLTEK